MSGLEIYKRVAADGVLEALLIYRLDGLTPTVQQCEDAGEDAGFYEPKIEAFHGYAEYKNARIVTEGFFGQLCHHEWGLWGHYGRTLRMHATCKKCGLFVSTATKKRSGHTKYTYDIWVLRHHIWQAWLKRGPVPNSLIVQEHHK